MRDPRPCFGPVFQFVEVVLTVAKGCLSTRLPIVLVSHGFTGVETPIQGPLQSTVFALSFSCKKRHEGEREAGDLEAPLSSGEPAGSKRGSQGLILTM